MVMITNSFDKFPNEPTGLMYEQFGKIGVNTASDSAWVLRVKLHLTTKSTSSQSGFIGLTNTTSGSNSSQDAIGMYFLTVNNTLFSVDSNGQTIAAGANSSNSFTTTNGNDYWIQITRLTPTTMRVEIFDNANYTGTASFTINDTIPSDITGLRYLKMQNREELGNNGSSDNWTGDDVKFYNGVSSVSSGSSPTFEDNFSNNSGWEYIGTVSYNASGYQNLNFARNGSNNGCYHDLTTVKQHFIEWFSGKQIPSYWNKRTIAGSGTWNMEDGVDKGLKVQFTSGRGCIDFGAIRPFSKTGSRFIAVANMNSTGNQYWLLGMKYGETSYSPDGYYFNYMSSGSTFTFASYGGGSSSTATATSVSTSPAGTFHVWDGEVTPSNMLGKVDGTLEATRTANMPQNNMHPFFFTQRDQVNGDGNIRYMECYNT